MSGRGWAVLAAFALCVPALAGSLLVTGGTSHGAPLVLALVVTALACWAAALGRWWLFGAAPSLALFLVLASPGVVSTRVDSTSELSRARFGLPFAYVEAELGITPPTFPQTASWNPWEDPAKLDVVALLASYAVVLVALSLVALSIHAWTSRGDLRRTTRNRASSTG